MLSGLHAFGRRGLISHRKRLVTTTTTATMSFTKALRPRQNESVNLLVADLTDESKRRALFVAPTGYGKTAVIAKTVEELASIHEASSPPDQRPFKVCVIVQSNTLNSQNCAKFSEWVPTMSTSMCGDKKNDWSGSVVFATIQTLSKKRNLQRMVPLFNLFVYDEAHHSAAESYQKIFKCNPNAMHFGVTATPFRGDKKSLDMFPITDCILYIDAVKEGILIKLIVKEMRPIGLDNDELNRCDSDRPGSDSKFAKLVDRRPVNAAVVKTWKQEAAGRQTVAFCSIVEHAQNICSAFKDGGVAVGLVYGAMPQEEKTMVLRAYETGELRVIVNVNMLTEGWDHPATSCVILLRPSSVLSAWRQMIGRGLRSDPNNPSKTDCLVLDFGISSRKHKLEPEMGNYGAKAEEKEGAKESEEERDEGSTHAGKDCVVTDRFVMAELELELGKARQEVLFVGTRKAPFYNVYKINHSDPWKIGEKEDSLSTRVVGVDPACTFALGYVAVEAGHYLCGIFHHGGTWVTVSLKLQQHDERGTKGEHVFRVLKVGSLDDCELAAATFVQARPLFAAYPIWTNKRAVSDGQRRSLECKTTLLVGQLNVLTMYQASILLSMGRNGGQVRCAIEKHFANKQ